MRDGIKFFLVILFFTLIIADRCLSDDDVPESDGHYFDINAEVSDVMFDLLRPAPRRRLYREDDTRYEFASDVVAAASKHNVPEFLLTVQIFEESSFRTTAVATDKPTVGLGQIHTDGVASRGCNLETRSGQLECSSRFLRLCFDKCKTWEGALIAYATPGYCSSSVDKVRKSARRRVRKWKKYENQRERIQAEILDDLEYYADLRESSE